MWVGTGDGVNLWEESTQQFTTFQNDPDNPHSLLGSIIQDIHETENGISGLPPKKGLNLYLAETKVLNVLVLKVDCLLR